MVKPGLVNLDFADVETIMKGMGKAMMGTGEAEGEKRAEEATNAALLNPLIDEYSLRGAKGLLVNITGGSDLTLFEVDEAVNKIRAEVDPEAELIFGSIEDERLNGKIRVSIVATSLDNQEPQIKPVVSMVHRIQSRNNGYSNNPVGTFKINNPTLNATEGATALNINNIIDENVSVNQKETLKEEAQSEHKVQKEENEQLFDDVSLESAAYLQNTEDISQDSDIPNFEVDSIEIANPQLFSDTEDNVLKSNNGSKEQDQPSVFEKEESTKEPEMFENLDSEENYEIPAFLRRQKS